MSDRYLPHGLSSAGSTRRHQAAGAKRGDKRPRAEEDHTRLRVTEVTSAESFDELRVEWNALVDKMECPSPFQSWEWNRTWWKHFGGHDKLRILVFRRGQQAVGIAPLYARSHGLRRIGPSSLVPIGGGHGHKH